MTRSGLVRCSVAVLVLTVCMELDGFPQQQDDPSRPDDTIKAEAARLYADAHPYMDEPMPELKKMGHELAGLKPVPDHPQLSDLLASVGEKADQLLQMIPDLISDEAVSQTQYPAYQGVAPGYVGGSGESAGRDQTFNYLILTRPAHDGRLGLREYRTSGKGKPIPLGTGGPNFQGFITAWIVFSSANQVESRFRYLGQQEADGHSTFVVGFAQIPGSVESPGRILSSGESVPMFLQGIAWIDQADFRIVRLRTDLLAPQPEILLQNQTANIVFGAVHIVGLDSELWLPQTVHVEMESRGQIFHEQHKYSKYRLYKVKSRIVLSPNN